MEIKEVRPPKRPRFLIGLILVLFLVRWWLGTLPGYPPDLSAYKRWAVYAGNRGVHTIYEDGCDFDYPPLYGYLLAPAGKLYALIDPEAAANFHDSVLIGLLVKIPPLVFDILIALLLARLVHVYGLWGRRRTWGGWLPALLYLFNPAVLFISGYWGQPDVVETFFALLALTLILQRRPELGWTAIALGCLMKPLAVPFLPLMALATYLRSGILRLLTGGAAALTTLFVGFLPFLLSGRGKLVLERFIGDVDLMAFTSVNGHNLWWLLGSWRSATAPVLGPLTPKMIGLTLAGTSILVVLWWLWRAERPRRRSPAGTWPGAETVGGLAAWNHWYLAAAAIPFSFFTLSTHMHENHLFPVLPFLILAAGRSRLWLFLMVVVSISLLINMATHDLILGAKYLRHIGGASQWVHPDIKRPLSNLELGLAYGNAAVTVLCYGGVMFAVRRACRKA